MAVADYNAAVLALSPRWFIPMQELESPCVDLGAAGQNASQHAGPASTFGAAFDATVPDALAVDFDGILDEYLEGSSMTAAGDNFTLFGWMEVDSFNFDASDSSGYAPLFETANGFVLLSGDAPVFGQPPRRMGGIWSGAFQGFAGTDLALDTPYFWAVVRDNTFWTFFLGGGPDYTAGNANGNFTGAFKVGRDLKGRQFGIGFVEQILNEASLTALKDAAELPAAVPGYPITMPPHLGGWGAA